MTEDQYFALFYIMGLEEGKSFALGAVRPHHAAAAIRSFLETGKPDWDAAMKVQPNA